MAVLNGTGTADPYARWQGSVGNRRPYALTGLWESSPSQWPRPRLLNACLLNRLGYYDGESLSLRNGKECQISVQNDRTRNSVEINLYKRSESIRSSDITTLVLYRRCKLALVCRYVRRHEARGVHTLVRPAVLLYSAIIAVLSFFLGAVFRPAAPDVPQPFLAGAQR